MTPTGAQLNHWARFKQVARRADLGIQAANLTAQNLVLAINYAKTVAQPISPAVHTELKKLQQLNQQNAKLKQAINGVEIDELGVRFRGNEMDILVVPGTSEDIWAKYQQFGWLVLVAGIVIGASVVTVIAALITGYIEADAKLSSMTDELDAQFCIDPNSAECKDWEALKQREGYAQRNNLISQLKSEANSLPSSVGKIASSIGLALIPVAIIVLGWAWGKGR
jgi:hypothetical protein